MLQLVMRSLFPTIFLLLLMCQAVTATDAFARLTLGASPGVTPGLETPDQARQLAATLADALGEEVVVRLFDEPSQIGQWLNQFAMLDLGVFDAAFLAAHPGEFLLLGPAGRLVVVARQGATGDIPQRVAAALRPGGGQPEPAAPMAPPATVEYRESPPAPGTVSSAGPLTLGLVAGPEGSVSDQAQAEQLAAILSDRFGIPLRPRLFDSERVLADWFCRFRMIDLAVIATSGRSDPLVGDYHSLLSLTWATPAGVAPELLVARRDLPEGQLNQLEQVVTACGGHLDLAGPLPVAMVQPPPAVIEPPPPVMPISPEPPEWPAVSPPPVLEPPSAPAESPLLPPSIGPLVAIEPQEVPAAAPAEPGAPPAPELPIILVLPQEVIEAPTAEVASEPAVIEEPAGLPPAEETVPSAVAPQEVVPPASAQAGDTPVPPPSPAESWLLPPSIGPIVIAAPEAIQPAVEAAPPVFVPREEVAPAPAQIENEPVVSAPPAAVPVAEVVPELPFVPVPPRIIEDVAPSTPPAEVAVEMPAPPPVVKPPVLSASVERPEPVAAEQVSPPVHQVDEPVPAPVTEESLPQPAEVYAVPAVIAQPDLPQDLRPAGVPLPRPGRLPKAPLPTEPPLLLAKLQEPLARTPKPPPLLPEPDPEPGVVYIVPFITLMVPTEVQERVFDQFVDSLNQQGAARQLKFVILKQTLDRIDRTWLGTRKYVLGEIFGYVEDSGCCSTDLRTRVRLTYYRANQPDPALKYEYPVRIFFEHERSTLAVERRKLADQIVVALVDELFKALQP